MPWKNCGQQVMHYDRYQMSFTEWVIGIGMGVGLDGIIAYTFYRSWTVFILLLPVAVAFPLYRRRELQKKRLLQLTVEFKEGIMALSASLSAGYSIENALESSRKELDLLYGHGGMINREFAYMVQQIRMNRPIELVMSDFGERSALEDVENFADIFTAAKRSGGNLVPIIRHTAEMIQDKIQIQEEIQTLTASKQFEQKIMNMIPFLIILYIDLTSPGFFNFMYETLMGRVVMTCCLAVYLFAYLMAEKILKITL